MPATSPVPKRPELIPQDRPRRRRGPAATARLIARYCGSRLDRWGVGYDVFHVLSPAGRVHRFQGEELLSQRPPPEDDGSGIDVRFEAEVYEAIGEEIAPILETMEVQSGGAPVEGDLQWTAEAGELPACVVELLIPRPNRLGETIVPAETAVEVPQGGPVGKPAWTPFLNRRYAKAAEILTPFQESCERLLAKGAATLSRVWRLLSTAFRKRRPGK